MNVATDISDTEFSQKLYPLCKEIKSNKNNLYTFKTQDKNYKIHFSYDLINDARCSDFSGVEYIVTYFNPKKNKNIIIETFFNACSLIMNHLKSLKAITGQLLMLKNKQIGKKRLLFHDEGTNLFLLQTHDSNKSEKIENISVLPQMTIRIDTFYLIPVMKLILFQPSLNSRPKKLIKADYDTIVKVDDCVQEIFNKFNKNNIQHLSLYFKKVKIIMNYLFLIFYKIDLYINDWLKEKNKKSDSYFKDFLAFASRHTNYDLFKGILQLLKEVTNKNEDAVFDIFIKLINQPEILYKTIYKKNKKPLSIQSMPPIRIRNQDGNFIPNPNFGNPNVSFLSYFEFMKKFKNDWLIINNIDTFSTTFPLQENSVLIENRLFYLEIREFVKDETKVNLKYNLIQHYENAYKKLIESSKVNDLNKKEWNPTTKRYIKKCQEGTRRNKKTFKCSKKLKTKTIKIINH
jgi:hypothetical protein